MISYGKDGLARAKRRFTRTSRDFSLGPWSCGKVEDGRGNLGHSATPRFPSPLIEPDVPISGIRLSDWFSSHSTRRCIEWPAFEAQEPTGPVELPPVRQWGSPCLKF